MDSVTNDLTAANEERFLVCSLNLSCFFSVCPSVCMLFHIFSDSMFKAGLPTHLFLPSIFLVSSRMVKQLDEIKKRREQAMKALNESEKV